MQAQMIITSAFVNKQLNCGIQYVPCINDTDIDVGNELPPLKLHAYLEEPTQYRIAHEKVCMSKAKATPKGEHSN